LKSDVSFCSWYSRNYMGRPIRIECAGVLYHITSRGNSGEYGQTGCSISFAFVYGSE